MNISCPNHSIFQPSSSVIPFLSHFSFYHDRIFTRKKSVHALKTIRKKILVGGFDRKIAQKLMKKLESTGFSAGLTEKKGCLAGE
ncbi:poly-gamma-glutamate hydrolase family protein [Bacillus subtilis]|uniref:poly-gamma-glutamate hydrolase family protein n=1 Tax=Bacillus subtilis TaxID=1423 RepID=UPI003AEFAC29